jgi:hypothetical protein
MFGAKKDFGQAFLQSHRLSEVYFEQGMPCEKLGVKTARELLFFRQEMAVKRSNFENSENQVVSSEMADERTGASFHRERI